MVDAVIAEYRSHISMGHDELSHLSNSILTRQLAIACWEACNGRKKILDIVQKLPMMRSFAEEITLRATAGFDKKEVQIHANEDHDLTLDSKPPLQEVGTTGLFTAAVRAEESQRHN